MLVQRAGGGARHHFLGGGITVRSGGGGAAAAPTYAEILRDTYGASEIWPLVNIASGTTIPAFINPARNGTLSGWALQNAAGPVTGTLAPLSDGVNDFGNILTSGGGVGLVDIFNPSTGSFFIWGQNSGAWNTDDRRLFFLGGSGLNSIQVRRRGQTNLLTFTYLANGATRNLDHAFSSASIFSAGFSWDTGANELKGFVDGSQIATTQTFPGVWNGGSLAEAFIGARNATGTAVWLGWPSYPAVKFGSVWTPAEFAAMHAAAATAGPDV